MTWPVTDIYWQKGKGTILKLHQSHKKNLKLWFAKYALCFNEFVTIFDLFFLCMSLLKAA